MTLDAFLEQLQGVQRHGTGIKARCPAHEDRRPSLSIREADDKLLLYCWAGCDTQAILQAMGLAFRDLWTTTSTRPPRVAQAQRRQRERRARQTHRHACVTMDALREAEALVQRMRGFDISAWSDAYVDRLMDRVSQAHQLLERHDLEAVDDSPSS